MTAIVAFLRFFTVQTLLPRYTHSQITRPRQLIHVNATAAIRVMLKPKLEPKLATDYPLYPGLAGQNKNTGPGPVKAGKTWSFTCKTLTPPSADTRPKVDRFGRFAT